MRYIDKSNRCEVFDDFVNQNQGRLRREWEKFKKIDKNGVVRLALHQHLWQEQKSLCCYCEQEIPKKTKLGTDEKSQMEHIRPKGRKEFKHLTFEFKNIIISCEGFDLTDDSIDKKNKRKFCGHIKDRTVAGVHPYNEFLFLNPTENFDIETYFRYDSEGNVEPNPSKNTDDQERAAYMIRILSLNHPTLIAMRKEQYSFWDGRRERLSYDEMAVDLDENLPFLPAFFSLLKQRFF